MKLREAEALAKEVCSAFKHETYIAGSIRRGVQDISDIDIIVINQSDWISIEALPFERVLGKDKKISMRIPLVECDMQIDFNFSRPECIGAALLHHTGSAKFNIIARVQAKRRGLKLNQYGLFRESSSGLAMPCSPANEADILRELGLIHHLDPRTRNK